jgi:hypothetical protein
MHAGIIWACTIAQMKCTSPVFGPGMTSLRLFGGSEPGDIARHALLDRQEFFGVAGGS